MTIRPLNAGFSALAAGRPVSVSGISSVRTGMRLRCASAEFITASRTNTASPAATCLKNRNLSIRESTIPPLSRGHICKRARSLRLQIELPGQRAETFHFRLDDAAKLLGRVAARLQAARRELTAAFRAVYIFHDLGMDAVDDRLRRAGGRDQPVPEG